MDILITYLNFKQLTLEASQQFCMQYLRGAIQTHCATLNVDLTLENWSNTPAPHPPPLLLLTSIHGTKKLIKNA